MNIREQLLLEHSKTNTNEIVDWIGTNKDRIDELMELFLTDEYRVVQRAAWVVSGISDLHPELLRPYLDRMIPYVKGNEHEAVTRSILRFFASLEDIPEDLQGSLADLAFDFLINPNTPVAIRVHSMQILANLCKVYPELAGELRIVLEEHMPNSSAGFRSRAKKILKQLDQEIK